MDTEYTCLHEAKRKAIMQDLHGLTSERLLLISLKMKYNNLPNFRPFYALSEGHTQLIHVVCFCDGLMYAVGHGSPRQQGRRRGAARGHPRRYSLCASQIYLCLTYMHVYLVCIYTYIFI
jgi:hypothetical protein